MKVIPISGSRRSIAFGSKIIDAHAHVGIFADGLCHTVDSFTADDIIEISKHPINGGEDVIEKVIVSNLDGIPQSYEGLDDVLKRKGISPAYLSEYDANMNLYRKCQDNPILKPLAVCQPERHADAEEIRRVLNEGEFYGLKFHPEHTKIAADDFVYDPYMKLAEEYNLPCLFHCDANGSIYSSPEQIYKLGKRYPKVPIILAHLGAGGDECHQKAIDVILESIRNDDALLYADVSWVNCEKSDKTEIVSAIRQLENSEKGDMTSRLLFGTDAPIGKFGAEGLKDENFYSQTVKDIKDSIRRAFPKKYESIINKLFYENAEKLFFERHKEKESLYETVKNTVDNSKVSSKNKYLKYMLGILLIGSLCAGVFYYLRNKKSNN